MELWVIWHERRDDTVAWRRGVIRSPDRPSTLKFVIELASVLLITGGIVGELWIGIEIASINGLLRTKSAELRGKSNQLVALLNHDAEGLKKETADERLAYARLWEEVGPRTIPNPATLAKKLEKFSPVVNNRVKLVFDFSDTEASLFGGQFGDIFNRAKIKWKLDPRTNGVTVQGEMGVLMWGRPKDKEFIQTLFNGLSAHERDRTFTQTNPGNEDAVVIIVGRKPIPGMPHDKMRVKFLP